MRLGVDADSPFRNGNFLRYWAACIISLTGSQLSMIAFPLLVLATTGSVAQAGVLASGRLISQLAARLPAGHLVDRTSRRRLMLIADLVRMMALASIPIASLLGLLSFTQLLAVAIVEGVGFAVFMPASSAVLRDIVPLSQRTSALSRTQSAYSTTILIGPLAGAALYAANHQLPFALDAASYAISAGLVVGMRLTALPSTTGTTGNRITAGFRWLAGQPNLLWLLLFAALLNMAGAACEIGVVIGLRLRHESPVAIGLVITCAGVGSVIGSLFAPALIRRLRPGLLLLLLASLWIVGFALFSYDPSIQAIGAIISVPFAFTPAAGILLGQALMAAPRSLQGRVSTAANASSTIATAIGPVGAGILIAAVGVERTWLLLASVSAIAALITRPLWQVSVLVAPQEGSAETGRTVDVAA